MELFDLLTCVLLALCGLVVYFEFLLTKVQRKAIAEHLAKWREELRRIPVYHVPQAELSFALHILDYFALLGGGFRRLRGMISLFMIASLAVVLGSQGVEYARQDPSSFLYLLYQKNSPFAFGLMMVTGAYATAHASFAFLRMTTSLVLARFENHSARGLIFLLWHSVTLAASVVVGPLILLLFFGVASMVAKFTEQGPSLWPIFWEQLGGTLMFRQPPLRVESGILPIFFVAAIITWMRIAILVGFVTAWLLAPLSIRFVYLNVRALADAEKGSLTVAALGLSAFIKGTQEIVKAATKWAG